MRNAARPRFGHPLPKAPAAAQRLPLLVMRLVQSDDTVTHNPGRMFSWPSIPTPIRLATWLFLAVLTGAILWAGFHTPIRRIDVLARPHAIFTDKAHGGRSFFESRKAGRAIEIAWELRPGAQYPFGGSQWSLRPSRDSLLDLSGFVGIEVVWRSARSLPIRWTLETHDPEITRPGIPLSLRFVQTERRPPREWTSEFIPEADFNVPPWWFQSNGRMLDSVRMLSRTASLDLTNGESALIGVPDTLQLRSVALLCRERRRPFMLVLLVPLGLFGWVLAGRKAPTPMLPVRPLPQEIPIPVSQRVVLYLAANYARPELCLSVIAKELNLSEAAVSAGVKEATGEGLRQHLGRLRLTEAARLVKESQMQMTEIAFRVGFSSAPHFNRQFRELWGCSPSEMRQNRPEKA